MAAVWHDLVNGIEPRKAARLATNFALLLLVAQTSATSAPLDTSFWVWDRHEPLTQPEAAALAAANVHALYWEMGELEATHGHWRWRWRDAAPTAPSGMQIVPVVRFIPKPPNSFGETSAREIVAALSSAPWLGGQLQVDCDTPDRLLPEYAALLRAVRGVYPHLQATALAGWRHLPAWNALKGSAEEWFPMFYDLAADPPLAGGAPPPFLDVAKVRAELAEWNGCGVPWCAGLPNFARVTLYNPQGVSRGHLRAWDWDDLCFEKALAAVGQTRLGATLFRVTTATEISETPLQKNESVGVRWPDREALRQALAAVAETDAKGVVFFRLPDSTDPSGWSLPQLSHLGSGPHLQLRAATTQQLELSNDADGDLEPRLSGTNEWDRGYALELDAPGPIFREALEGDFWRVTSHAASGPVAMPLATRLTFWFSHLRARSILRSGLIQLSPGASFAQLRYRVLNTPEASAWQPIAPSR